MDRNKTRELERTIAAEYGNVAGIVVRRGGETVYEGCFNGYSPDDSFHVFSVTKSVVSALIGMAIDRGCIESVDCRVLDFFPDYSAPEGEETIQDIRIKHLLTMTAPYKYEVEPYAEFFASGQPVRDALDYLGGDGKIGAFNYSAIGGTHILSAILARAIGRHILGFAQENLFSPLGIEVPHNLVIHDEAEHLALMNDRKARGWVVDPEGLSWAGWGLFLKAEDMAKFGELYLNGGTWNGTRIVSSSWVAESTREHSRCTQWGNLAYGYLWWLVDGDSFAALGDGGNVIYVNRANDTVISIASTFMQEARDRIELIKKHIEPAISGFPGIPC
jgi:CubicO group peptidase (beta-lactamase class C family)